MRMTGGRKRTPFRECVYVDLTKGCGGFTVIFPFTCPFLALFPLFYLFSTPYFRLIFYVLLRLIFDPRPCFGRFRLLAFFNILPFIC